MPRLAMAGASAARALGFLRTAIANAVDQYFNLTTLLLPGNGTNGAQNNTFTDSSSNGFGITRNPSTGPNAPTQGTFSPFSQTGWGNYFDGSNSFLQIVSPSSALTDWTTTNWTLEYWIYANAFGQGANTGSNVFGNANDGGTSEYWSFGPISTGAVKWYYYNGGSVQITTTTTLSTNRWYHLAFVNNSNNLTIYIDGVSSVTGTKAGTPQFGSSVAMTLGKSTGSSFNGYISNLRITQSAVYTSNFTPSTAPLTAISGTQLLMCQSNRFRDISTNAFVFTPSGTPSVQAFSPFAPTAAYSAATVGGSGYFDGTGDYLNSTITAFGSGNFTIECWVYFTASVASKGIFHVATSSALPSTVSGVALASGSAGGWTLYYNNGSQNTTTTLTAAQNTWIHLAVVKSGTTIRVYVDGVMNQSQTDTANYTSQVAAIGGFFSTAYLLTGYISGFKVTSTADYSGTSTTTANFTLPTAPPSPTGSILCCNFTNAGITDATAKNDLETVGNAQISTTQSKFGGSSMYFDGTGDYLKGDAFRAGLTGSGDFTIECWIYISSLPGVEQSICSTTESGGTGIIFGLAGGGNVNKIQFAIGNLSVSNPTVVDTVNFTTGSWVHVAAVRSNGTISLYKDGTSVGTPTSATATLDRQTVTVGAWPSGSATFTGYIDDLRISRYARYVTGTGANAGKMVFNGTNNLALPTTAFPLQ